MSGGHTNGIITAFHHYLHAQLCAAYSGCVPAGAKTPAAGRNAKWLALDHHNSHVPDLAVHSGSDFLDPSNTGFQFVDEAQWLNGGLQYFWR